MAWASKTEPGGWPQSASAFPPLRTQDIQGAAPLLPKQKDTVDPRLPWQAPKEWNQWRLGLLAQQRSLPDFRETVESPRSAQSGQMTQLDLQAFFSRQETHSATKRRRLLTKQTRSEVERRKKAQEAAVLSPSTKDGFIELLSRKFGSPARAWRLHLDSDGNGRLSAAEFFAAVRGLGFSGNLKQLWDELDENGSGMISLQEIDADAYKHITAFKSLLQTTYGNTLQAWLKSAAPLS
jgi:hypothetical protein